jgi:hypothetical protein
MSQTDSWIQFVWVSTTTTNLDIPASALDQTGTRLGSIAAQLNANLQRLNSAFAGTLRPVGGTNAASSNNTFQSFKTKETLTSNYPILTVSDVATTDDYTKKSFIKITAPLRKNKTDITNAGASVPASYLANTALDKLLQLYTQQHPEFAATPEKDYFIIRDKALRGKFVVFIVNLTDQFGLPVPLAYQGISYQGHLYTFVAISPWTIGDHTNPNTWISDLSVFDRVPWYKQYRKGGSLVFALGTACGVGPYFGPTGPNKYPNIHVDRYNASRSNFNNNSKQILYFSGDPTLVRSDEVNKEPYNNMDMSGDDVRYFFSTEQANIIKDIHTEVPGDPNDPKDPRDPNKPDPPPVVVKPEVKNNTDPVAVSSSTSTLTGESAGAFIVLAINLFVIFMHIGALVMERNPKYYYRNACLSGEPGKLLKLFMKPIYLGPGECATVYLDKHDQDCLHKLNHGPQPTEQPNGKPKRTRKGQNYQDNNGELEKHVYPETNMRGNLTRVGTPTRQPLTITEEPTELETALDRRRRGTRDTPEPTTPLRASKPTTTAGGSNLFMVGQP